MSKIQRRAIMNSSRFLNKYRKKNKKQEADWHSKKERNFYVKQLRKAKREFYDNVNVKSITYNNEFWKTATCYFIDKTLKNERITLVKEKESYFRRC